MTSPQNADAILMLDDEFDIMNIFTLALEQSGFHVIGFTEPLLALDNFQKNSDLYWLVVADIRMPLMDGYQFIKRVKEIKPQVKVFFMSAFLIDDIQFRIGLSLVRVDEYIEKPISINDFVRLVKKYFLMTEASKN
jgi:two-component system cell cycle sensor histidine kinase/response regulator CckA